MLFIYLNKCILIQQTSTMDNLELEQKAEAWVRAVKKAEEKIKREEEEEKRKKEEEEKVKREEEEKEKEKEKEIEKVKQKEYAEARQKRNEERKREREEALKIIEEQEQQRKQQLESLTGIEFLKSLKLRDVYDPHLQSQYYTHVLTKNRQHKIIHNLVTFIEICKKDINDKKDIKGTSLINRSKIICELTRTQHIIIGELECYINYQKAVLRGGAQDITHGYNANSIMKANENKFPHLICKSLDTPFLYCFKDILEVPTVAEPEIVSAVAEVKVDAPIVEAVPIKKKTKGGKRPILRSVVAEVKADDPFEAGKRRREAGANA